MEGMRELKKLGLLEVEYDVTLIKDGVFVGKEPNKYRIKLLLSQEEIDKKWDRLKNIYGDELVRKARKLAYSIEEDNDVEIVESFIQIIGKYGEDWVNKATEKTARKSVGNPSRNFGYIVGILKSWEKGSPDRPR
jgi:hypothetical protein